jgi:CBS domain-containing protein
MLVRDLMTQPVRTATPDSTLAEIAQQMWDGDCGCVPVIDEQGRPIGMLTDRDLAMAAWTTGLSLGELVARTAMSRIVYVVHEDDSPAVAEEVMHTRRVRRLPVVDRDGRLVGVLSLADLFRRADIHPRVPREGNGLSADAVAWTLAGIVEPSSSARSTASRASRPGATLRH